MLGVPLWQHATPQPQAAQPFTSLSSFSAVGSTLQIKVHADVSPTFFTLAQGLILGQWGAMPNPAPGISVLQPVEMLYVHPNKSCRSLPGLS